MSKSPMTAQPAPIPAFAPVLRPPDESEGGFGSESGGEVGAGVDDVSEDGVDVGDGSTVTGV